MSCGWARCSGPHALKTAGCRCTAGGCSELRSPDVRTVTSAVERRFAVVVSANGKGYSRLISEDEIGTVRGLTAYRSIMHDTITKFHGRVIDTPRDNVLAEFGSIVDAVSYAVEIQGQIATRNAELPERRRLEFRLMILRIPPRTITRDA